MARGSAALAVLLLGVLGTLLRAQHQDFDLSDALGGDEEKKPTKSPKKPSFDGDLDLLDALGGDEEKKPTRSPRKPHIDDPALPPRPKPQPSPKHPDSNGGFSDSDLADGIPDRDPDGYGGGGDGGTRRKDEQEDSPQGVVPGIVGAVVVAVAGAISSFIAYQKKKFCFKDNAEQGGMDLDNRNTVNAEPPAQQTLLQK